MSTIIIKHCEAISAQGLKLPQIHPSMDFGHSSEAFIPDQTPPLESTLLTRIVDFVGESGSLEQYGALSVWRSLSQSNRAIAEGAVQAQKTWNFAGCRDLTDTASQHLAKCPQLQTVNFHSCVNLTDEAAQYLAQCPQLESVDFECCGKLTDAAAEHLAQCPQLQTVDFGECEVVW